MIPRIVARLASKSLIFAALVVIAALAALTSCGTSSDGEEGGVRFAGCEPEGIATHLGGFLNAVSARQETRVLRYIAPEGEFMKFTLYDWVTPGGGRDDSRSAEEMHDSFVAAIPKNHVSEFLAVEVGKPGPFAPEYEDRVGPRETAGIQIAARIGEDRFLAGKLGLECEGGRIYSGAMNLRRHLEARTVCGRALGAGAETAVCRIR
jgi:hypothetical protein